MMIHLFQIEVSKEDQENGVGIRGSFLECFEMKSDLYLEFVCREGEGGLMFIC